MLTQKKGLDPFTTGMAANAALPTLGAVATSIKQGMRSAVLESSSIASTVQRAVIAPYVLVEESLRNQPYITDLLQANLNLFSAYYLLMVGQIAEVGGVSVMDRLDAINPGRKVNVPASAVRAATNFFSQEEFALGLPKAEVSQKLLSKGRYDAERKRYVFSEEAQSNPPQKPEAPVSQRQATVTALEASNLAVGKMLEVNLNIDGKKFSVPTLVKLLPNTINSEGFGHILGLTPGVYKLRERWHDWRADIISGSEFVFMTDIFAQRRKLMMLDRSGYFRAVMKRNRGNKMAAYAKKSPSLAEASSTFIVTRNTLSIAEAQYGVNFNNFADRERLFEATQTMLWFVVDPEWESVEIYHSGLESSSKLLIRDLKSASKNSGPDIGEILKAYQLGRTPSF